jgi:D-methionine transport system ATP-binding protein
MISISNVSKKFGLGERAVAAVDGVSLEVEPGEIFGVLGPSGAGKSTLIRCVNLLERPDSGSIRVDGQELTALSPAELRQARTRIGMIFQHFNLLNSRTVAGNVAFPLEVTGLNRAERDARVRELLEMVGLSDKALAYPSQLSGGQKQRVAIARALATQPRVLLSDEATSALDPQNTSAILARYRITQRLFAVIVNSLQISSLVSSMISRIMKTRAVLGGRRSRHASMTSMNSFWVSAVSGLPQSAGGAAHPPLSLNIGSKSSRSVSSSKVAMMIG